MGLTTPEGGDGWKELADGGISVVRSKVSGEHWTTDTQGELERYMDVAHSHGMYVWPMLHELVSSPRPGADQRLREFINRFKTHPGLLFWKSADEPEWGKIPAPRLVEAYHVIRDTDPDHPVWICHAPRGTLQTLAPYNDACDILSTDIYPVSFPPGKHSLQANKAISMVGDYTRRMMQLSGGKKMVFMVLQAGWSGIDPRNNPKNRVMFPTSREERYMLYQAIINGANSVSFFGFPVALSGRDAQLGWNWTFWRAVVKPLLEEIRPGSELYPVLTAPETTCPLTFTGKPFIEARWKEVGPYLYIFAAAREGKERRVTFSGIGDGSVAVLHEDRMLEGKNGSFSDTFKEHDVHIYRALREPKGMSAAVLATVRKKR